MDGSASVSVSLWTKVLAVRGSEYGMMPDWIRNGSGRVLECFGMWPEVGWKLQANWGSLRVVELLP